MADIANQLRRIAERIDAGYQSDDDFSIADMWTDGSNYEK
jgi:hypothetical protein